MSIQTSGTETTETVVPLTAEYPVARVDLMPPEVLANRRFRRAQRYMGGGVVVVVLGIGGGWFLADAAADAAAAELAAEQARTTQLQAEAAQFAQVPAILASVDRAQSALATAMAADVEWYRYISQMGENAPAGVWFQSLTVSTLTPGALSADPLAPVDAVAEISTTGRAAAYVDVATWMDSFEGITTLDYVLVPDATLDDDSGVESWVDFTATTKVSPEAYSERYAQEGQ